MRSLVDLSLRHAFVNNRKTGKIDIFILIRAIPGKHMRRPVSTSIRESIRPSVRPSIGRTVGHTFVKNKQELTKLYIQDIVFSRSGNKKARPSVRPSIRSSVG